MRGMYETKLLPHAAPPPSTRQSVTLVAWYAPGSPPFRCVIISITELFSQSFQHRSESAGFLDLINLYLILYPNKLNYFPQQLISPVLHIHKLTNTNTASHMYVFTYVSIKNSHSFTKQKSPSSKQPTFKLFTTCVPSASPTLSSSAPSHPRHMKEYASDQSRILMADLS